MKVLIGILYTIEQEYDACREAINNQTFKNTEVFVVENLPNKLAHDTLYSKFMESASEFDYFIKIDADMVLYRNDILEKIIQKMESNPDVDLIETWIHDFFSDTLIGALNTFRNTVKWNLGEEQVFVDRIVEYKKRILDKDDLAPAAYHCPDPSLFQCFHFGVHKAIKASQFLKDEKQEMAAKEHWNNIRLTAEHFKRTNDKRLGLAVLGSEIVFRKRFISAHANYDNPELIRWFNRYENLSADQITRELRRLSLASWSFLPAEWRQGVFLRIRKRSWYGFINSAIFVYLVKMIYYSFKKTLFPEKFNKHA